MKRHGCIQRGLTAKGWQDCVRLFLHDDGLDYLRGNRLNVCCIGEVGVGHDGRRVRVDQDHTDTLFAKDAARLGARVVKLARLTDNDRAGADH